MLTCPAPSVAAQIVATIHAFENARRLEGTAAEDEAERRYDALSRQLRAEGFAAVIFGGRVYSSRCLVAEQRDMTDPYGAEVWSSAYLLDLDRA